MFLYKKVLTFMTDHYLFREWILLNLIPSMVELVELGINIFHNFYTYLFELQYIE